MATNEAWVLDTLALNDGTTFTVEAEDVTPPPELEEWIKGADSDGSLLVREPKTDNRTITMNVRVEPQATMNLALQKIALIVDKLKECQRNANGLALTWVPANSTLPTVTFRCLSGQVTQMPVDVQNGWLVNAPLLSLKLTCLPFAEGTESQVATVTSSAPIIVLPDITGLAGDVPALGRLVVLEAASQNRRYVAWGLESRYYPTSSPPSLIVDSSSMVTSGFAGVTATNTGAYSSATNNVISVVTRTQPQAVCGLGNLSHVGSFRPQLRCWASGTTIAFRLSWKALDGPLRSLSYKVPVAVGFNHIDLGLVTVPLADVGTQRWTGQIEAYSTATGGETFQVDALWMMPAELYGKARATPAPSPGVLAVYDDFNSITAGTALNTRVAPVGGTWATNGPAGDFSAADAPASFDETMFRSTTADAGVFRQAIIGSAVAATEISVRLQTTSFNAGLSRGLIARWANVTNYLRVLVAATGSFQGASATDSGSAVFVQKVVAGTVTTLASWFVGINLVANTWYSLKVILPASGVGIVTLYDANGAALSTGQFFDTVLATGGTLASGQVGFTDVGPTTASTRYYDNFVSMAPGPEPIVCYAGRTIEFRDDATLRQDSTGTYYGQPPEYVGARFKIPNAGGPARETRIAVIARRLDVETGNDDTLVGNATTDSTTVTAFATPRFLTVPR